jgi:hypothetical protein
MKTNKLIPLIVAIATLSTQAQDNKEPAKEGSKTTPIVFVPNKLLTQNIPSGKLKENTFYWANPLDDAESGPKPIQEEANTFLRMEGSKKFQNKAENGEPGQPWQRALTQVVRAYNIPKDATTAKITIAARSTNDIWADPLEGKGGSRGAIIIANNGKSVEEKLALIPKLNSGWATNTQTITLPANSQQLLIKLESRIFMPLDVSTMEVVFSN